MNALILLVFLSVSYVILKTNFIINLASQQLVAMGLLFTFTGWYATYVLARKNSSTQIKNQENNKSIENIENILRELSNNCSSASFDNNTSFEPIDFERIIRPNINSIAKLRIALERYKNINGNINNEQSIEVLILDIKKLVTNEDSFNTKSKIITTATRLHPMEIKLINFFERKY